MSFIQRLNHMSGTWKRWAVVAGLGAAMVHPQTVSAVEKSKKIQVRRAKKSKRKAPKMGELRKISVAEKPSGELFVELSLSAPGNFNAYRTHDPERLVVDLVGTKPGKLGRRKDLSTWVSSGVLVYPVEVAGFEATRIEVELRRNVSYELDGSKRSIRLSLVPETPAPARSNSASSTTQDKAMQAKLEQARKRVLAMQNKEREAQAKVALADKQLRERQAQAQAQAAKADKLLQDRQAQAQAAMLQADQYLAQAKKAKQESLELRAQAKAQLAKVQAAKAKARKQAKDAGSRAKLAQSNLALRKDKVRLRSLLAQETKTRHKLEREMTQRSQRISRLEQQVKRAQLRMQKTDLPGLRRALAQSRAQQRSLELASAAMRQDLERMKKASEGQNASKKEAKVYRAMFLERQAILSQTKERLLESKKEQRRVKAALAQGKGKTRALAKAHAKAKQRLATAQAQLEQMHNKTGEQTQALRKVQGELRQAQAKLHRTLETLAMQAQAHEKALASASAKKQPKAERRRLISGLKLIDEGDSMRIVLNSDGPVEISKRQVSPTMQLLEVKNAKLIPELERSFDARAYKGPVAKITSFNDDSKVSIMVTAAAQAKSKVVRQKGVVSWVFPKDAPALAQHQAPRVERMHDAPVAVASASSKGASRVGTNRRKKWHGEKIDIELQNAPVKDILLLFSDIGRVNIIAGKDVSGQVSLKLNSVPWDQALDIILRSLGLGLIKEGNVIRVATTADLEAERARAIERASAQVQLKPLETRLVPLSYATVDEMVPKVQSVLSSRGTVTPDTRTNVLIIMDVAENISLAEQLVSQLDGQTPQVLIEARIVEARTQWLRQLGIQWGFDAIASPGTGNPTGLLFPSSVGVAGGSGGGQADRRGIILSGSQQNPNYAVDLPAPVGSGNGGAIGMSFGSLAGNLNTNLRLSAAEEGGEVRLISAPKVVTMDNTKASIEQGVQIPISQVSQNGVNTRYVNATLGLQVTPHVTNEGSIVLEVQVQKNEADFVNTGARGDPTILTKRAKSRMLIQDGDTAVIGGIYTRNQSTNRKKVPWIAEVPILGWFFKNRSEADTRTELLIFLTPKIINRSTSIGG